MRPLREGRMLSRSPREPRVPSVAAGVGCARRTGEVTRRAEVGEGGVRMKSLIEDIVKALVDRPEEVQIKEVIGDHAHVLELRVSKEDLGKVIGKGGAHASAIRTLMAAASGKEKKRYILEIIEN